VKDVKSQITDLKSLWQGKEGFGYHVSDDATSCLQINDCLHRSETSCANFQPYSCRVLHCRCRVHTTHAH